VVKLALFNNALITEVYGGVRQLSDLIYNIIICVPKMKRLQNNMRGELLLTRIFIFG